MIANDAVTYDKMQDIGTANRVLGSTSADGAVTEVQVATNMIANGAVTYDKMQDIGTANRVLGASTAGTIGEVRVVTNMADTGIDTDKLVKTSVNCTNGEYAKFTADGLESKPASEVLSEIGAQASLTFGIGHTNAVKIDGADIANGQYAQFTSYGLKGVSSTEQNITNIKDLFNIDDSNLSNLQKIENLNNKVNYLIDLLKLAIPNLL